MGNIERIDLRAFLPFLMGLSLWAAGEHRFPDNHTTFPTRAAQDKGYMVPKIALVYGDHDALQDVLAKAGRFHAK